jgi:hypothetical protein
MTMTEKPQNKATKPLWKRILIGRNIDRIVDHADCAVLIVRIHLSQEEKGQEAAIRARSLTQSLMRSLKNGE